VDIIVDTNILVADYQLNGTAFRVAFDGIHRTDWTLLVPQVVLAEVVSKYREQLLEVLAQHQKARDTLRRITGRELPGEDPVANDVQVEIGRFAERFPRMLTERGAKLLPWPAVDHQAVVGRLLRGRRPMRKDVGYRDTLVWETIVTHLRSSERTQAVFVTRDRDFLDGSGLHPDLLEDLREAGVDPARLSVEDSLAALNKRVFEPTLALLDEVKDQLQRGAFPYVDLRAWVARSLRDLIQEDDLRGTAIDLPHGCGKVDLSSANEVTSFEVSDVRRLSSGDLLVA
jgi:hypothetical protein